MNTPATAGRVNEYARDQVVSTAQAQWTYGMLPALRRRRRPGESNSISVLGRDNHQSTDRGRKL